MSEEGVQKQELNKKVVAEIEKTLSRSNPNLFKKINADEKKQLISSVQSITITKTHSGPLPHPETLKGYDEVIPNGGERIMVLTERNFEHRTNIETKIVDSQTNQVTRGQWMAFIIALSFLGCATACILNGKEWHGSAIGISTLVALVYVFMTGNKYQDRKK